MGIEEEEKEIQTKVIGNLFNIIIAEKFPNFKQERLIKVQKAYRISHCQDQKRNTPRHIITKTLNKENKQRLLIAAKEKRLVT
jgi:hypothetical protein